MGARAISLVPERQELGAFSLSWRGYDRSEVDAFLERTAADRERLQADLAQLEAALSGRGLPRHQELERMAALRSELARCLETSINALHLANLLLVSPDGPVGVGDAAFRASSAEVPERPAAGSWPLPAWLSPARALILIGMVSAAAGTVSALGTALPGSPSAPGPVVRATVTPPVPDPSPRVATGARSAAEPIAAATVEVTPPRPTAPVAPADGLALTLTATGECWIQSTLDGGEPRERLLKAGDTITLRAGAEVILRVGDPAALMLEINGHPASPLGTAGRVATARITPSNYLGFLSGR